MQTRARVGILLLLTSCIMTLPAAAACPLEGLAPGTPVVELELSRGTLCIELFAGEAPAHVENFLWYLENGHYDGTPFHRLVEGFVAQAGELRRSDRGGWKTVQPRASEGVRNEPCLRDTPSPTPDLPDLEICSLRGNERGSVALAKVAGRPHSGSTNWYINLADNRRRLDNENEGSTVFGRVIGDGMTIVDAWVSTGELAHWLRGPLRRHTAALNTMPHYGELAGCFDPLGRFAAAVTPEPGVAAPTTLKRAPETNRVPYLLSLACGGSPVEAPARFEPATCAGRGGRQAELAIEISGPVTRETVSSPARYFVFGCEEVTRSLEAMRGLQTALRSQAPGSFAERYAEQLVTIERGRLLIAPPHVE